MLDGAADQMACKTLLDRLPPMVKNTFIIPKKN